LWYLYRRVEKNLQYEYAKEIPRHYRFRPNRRFKKYLAKKFEEAHNLGFVKTIDEERGEWLEQIHKEIFDKKPQWEKDMINADLASLARGEEPDTVRVEWENTDNVKPELNDDYLRSIGREDLIYWPQADTVADDDEA
jgi:hypothetical protein